MLLLTAGSLKKADVNIITDLDEGVKKVTHLEAGTLVYM